MSRGNPWWDQWFLGMAAYVATASKDPSTKVGAVLVNSDRKIIGTGYNGFPKKIKDHEHRLLDKDYKHPVIIHAEANAIYNAIQSPAGATIYSTFFPCPSCAAMLIQNGIKRVVAAGCPSDERYTDKRNWSMDLFKEAGVSYGYYGEKLAIHHAEVPFM